MRRSRRQRLSNIVARYVQKPAMALIPTQPMARAVFDLNARMLYKRPRDLQSEAGVLSDGASEVPVLWAWRDGQAERGVLLFLHGGGFVIGSVKAYRHLAAEIGAQSGLRACLVDYRLAPEHPFPAAPNDALTAYRGLLAAGYPPDKIALCGDSAGGCLTLALLHMIRAEGLPMPAAAAVMSPITDLAMVSPSMEENRKRDLLISERWGQRGIRDYLAGGDPGDPRASPIHGRFDGAPPVFIQYVEEEVLRDEAVRMAEVLKNQGVAVSLERWSGVPHVWHLMCGRVPEADQGIREISGFLNQHLA